MSGVDDPNPMGYLLRAMLGTPLTSREKTGGPYTHSFCPEVTHWPTPEEHEEMQSQLDDWFAIQEEHYPTD